MTHQHRACRGAECAAPKSLGASTPELRINIVHAGEANTPPPRVLGPPHPGRASTLCTRGPERSASKGLRASPSGVHINIVHAGGRTTRGRQALAAQNHEAHTLKTVTTTTAECAHAERATVNWWPLQDHGGPIGEHWVKTRRSRLPVPLGVLFVQVVLNFLGQRWHNIHDPTKARLTTAREMMDKAETGPKFTHATRARSAMRKPPGRVLVPMLLKRVGGHSRLIWRRMTDRTHSKGTTKPLRSLPAPAGHKQAGQHMPLQP